jgi:hypothetical protein
MAINDRSCHVVSPVMVMVMVMVMVIVMLSQKFSIAQ